METLKIVLDVISLLCSVGILGCVLWLIRK
jgi:hypothetical protein